jgi:hypothetical protein
VRNDDAIPVLGVPNIVILERIHVHLEVTIVIEVDVGNKEEMYDTPSVTAVRNCDMAV